MKANLLEPRKALNKVYLNTKIVRDEMDNFKFQMIAVLDAINVVETEEFHKNLVISFLKKTFYDPNYFVNTKGRNDLVIHNGKDAKSSVGVIIEAKSPTNKAEMITAENLNGKALQGLVLYYLRERITHKNTDLKQLVVTNIYEWFIFDAHIFNKCFAENKKLVKDFNDFEEKRTSGKTTDFFYKEIAKPFIESIKNEIEFTHFNIKNYENALRNDDKDDDKLLVALFKLISPEHLLKLPFANDSNTLDKNFYEELLHIIGLTEIKDGGKKIIVRHEPKNRNAGSLLENTINQLESLDKITRLKNPKDYGDTKVEVLFGVALELCITWVNRILFLKLLEAQIISYHKNDKKYSFLNMDLIKDYDKLNTLFFQVLAIKLADRNKNVFDSFFHVPYLNSSLFEPTELEHETLFISGLEDDSVLNLLPTTVIKDNFKKKTGGLNSLEYFFSFLDAYNFATDATESFQADDKKLISAAVLGLIFEKINGYKDGSFFTPSFITMYMCRETIRRAVVQKFNTIKGWDCSDFEALKNKNFTIDEANKIVNSIKICDPAVGSGHFLVSALNEIVAIKHDLEILVDKNNIRIKNYKIEIINDEIIMTDDEGVLFQYLPKIEQSQRIQETLFHEKKTIIEHCLFGVDINPNSVKICQLRLWIELLKNAYYHTDTNELETFPNIDINIKCGNSLISRFEIDADLKKALKDSKWTIDTYKNAVLTYQNSTNKVQKREMQALIEEVKTNFKTEIATNDPKKLKLEKIKGELFNKTNQTGMFELGKKEKEIWNKQINALASEMRVLETDLEDIKSSRIYDRAFEWRFEFPQVLNDDGDFEGFDVVIGNPPYIKEYEGKEKFDGLRTKAIYQGKMDIWYLFVADGIRLLKTKGILNFIAPNNWTTNSGASKTRDFILTHTKILQLIDFNTFMVFDSASIQTMIMQFSNEKADNYSFDYRKIKTEKPNLDTIDEVLKRKEATTYETLEPKIVVGNFIDKTFSFNNAEKELILDKIQLLQNFYLDEKDEIANGIHPHHDFVNSKMLKDLQFKYKVGDGIFGLSEVEKKGLKFNKKELALIKPYYTTEQLSRYYGNAENKLWLIYTSSSFNKIEDLPINYPNIINHLDQFKAVITSDNAPYGLHRTRKEHFFKDEKIIVQRKCAGKPVFCFTDFDCYVSATFYVIKTNRLDNKYLTGLLNSKLIEFWLKNKGKMQGNNYQLDKEPLLKIPILKPTDKKSESSISKKVDKILALKQANPQADTLLLEQEIDQIVYGLYGLSGEEIGIIEKV